MLWGCELQWKLARLCGVAARQQEARVNTAIPEELQRIDDLGKSIRGGKLIGSHIKTSGMHMRTRIANAVI